MIKLKHLFNPVICLVKGHIRARQTVETETAVHKFSCKRCGRPLDIGFWKNAPAPPGCGHGEWEVYKLEAINNYLSR